MRGQQCGQKDKREREKETTSAGKVLVWQRAQGPWKVSMNTEQWGGFRPSPSRCKAVRDAGHLMPICPGTGPLSRSKVALGNAPSSVHSSARNSQVMVFQLLPPRPQLWAGLCGLTRSLKASNLVLQGEAEPPESLTVAGKRSKEATHGASLCLASPSRHSAHWGPRSPPQIVLIGKVDGRVCML